MNKGPNATIRLVRRQNHAGTTVSWTTVQREKNSHAYKLSSNVQTACSTDSLNNCPKHSILRFSSFVLIVILITKGSYLKSYPREIISSPNMKVHLVHYL